VTRANFRDRAEMTHFARTFDVPPTAASRIKVVAATVAGSHSVDERDDGEATTERHRKSALSKAGWSVFLADSRP